jgi:hypothetical protein
MPRFAPDMEGTRATTRIFERGEYEIELKKPTGRVYVKDDGTEVANITYFATMIGKIKADGKLDDEFEGEDVSPIRMYAHTEGAFRMTKQFLMAAYGYNRDEEDVFNKEVGKEKDWTLDGEEDETIIGSGYSDVAGNRVRVTLDKEKYEGREQQDFRAFFPVKSKKK